MNKLDQSGYWQGAQGVGACEPAPCREYEIQRSLRNLDREACEVLDRANALIARIAPVLGPEPPPASGGNTCSPPLGAPLANDMDTIARTVRAATERLSEALARLELP